MTAIYIVLQYRHILQVTHAVYPINGGHTICVDIVHRTLMALRIQGKHFGSTTGFIFLHYLIPRSVVVPNIHKSH